MTQYLLAVHNAEDEKPYADDAEMQAAFAAVDVFNTKIQAEGVWVFGGGLQPASTASVVDNTKGGDAIITDGPYVEAKEHIGGFWVIEAPDLDVALRWATEASAACRREVEVRPFQD